MLRQLQRHLTQSGYAHLWNALRDRESPEKPWLLMHFISFYMHLLAFIGILLAFFDASYPCFL